MVERLIWDRCKSRIKVSAGSWGSLGFVLERGQGGGWLAQSSGTEQVRRGKTGRSSKLSKGQMKRLSTPGSKVLRGSQACRECRL